MMLMVRGRRHDRASRVGSIFGLSWVLVSGAGWGVVVVEEEEVGQDFFCRLWALDWLLVRVLLPWIGAGLRTKPRDRVGVGLD
jgi:hypothetical protein